MPIYPVANARHHMMIFIYFIYIYMYIYVCVFVKLEFEMSTVHGQQHSFSTHERIFLRECQNIWDKKCFDPGVTWTPTFIPTAEPFELPVPNICYSIFCCTGSSNIEIIYTHINKQKQKHWKMLSAMPNFQTKCCLRLDYQRLTNIQE